MADLRVDAPIKELRFEAVTFRPCPKHHNMNLADIGACADCDLEPREQRTVVWRNPDYYPEEEAPRRSWLNMMRRR